MTYGAPAARPNLTAADREALEAAVAALERTSFARRLAAMTGRQIGFAGRAIPPRLQEAASTAAAAALQAALGAALRTLENAPARDGTRLHRALAAATGAIGGAAGLAGLPVELPVSTTIMLRAIADVARAEGEDLSHPETRIACLEVFALGGHGENGEVLEGGYLALRGLFAKSVSDATRYVAAGGAANEAAPALTRLVARIAERFGVAVSQKAAAQAVPALGAISGAAVNLAFADHFQRLARGHFTVRRLERAYGQTLVREEYARIARDGGFWRDAAGAG
jgi:hypothetical protein